MPTPQISTTILNRKLALRFLRSREPEVDVAHLREMLSPTEYGPFQDELRRLQLGNVRVAATLLTPSLSQLSRLSYPEPMEAEREIKWAKAVLSRYTTELTHFMHLRTEFSRAVLTGQHGTARHCLDRVEAQFGQSFWLIKNRLAFLQLSAGLEAQKRYAHQLKESVAFVGPLAVVTQWVSARNESTVSTTRFKDDFEQYLARYVSHLPEGVVEYLRYHILTTTINSPSLALHALRLESARALIDFYEAFLAYGQSVALAELPAQQTQILYAVRALTGRLSDPRLNVLLTVLGPSDIASTYTSASTVSYDQLCAGDYADAYATSKRELLAAPDEAVALVLAALSGALSTENNEKLEELPAMGSIPGVTLQTTLLQGLRAVAQNGAAAHQAIRELSKLTLNFAALDWSAAVELLVADELSAQISNPLTAGAALVIPRWHPLLLEALGPAHTATRYAAVIEAEINTSLGARYALAKVGGPGRKVSGLSLETGHLLRGYQHYMGRQFAAAIRDGSTLTASTHGYFQRRGHRLIANSLLQEGALVEACAYMAQQYVRDEHLVPLLPLAEAVGTLRPDQPAWQQLQDQLTLPILLDAHTRHVNRTTESLCGYAYEDFLLAHGVERPSQLLHLEKFDQDQLVYYLRYVCVEAIMDASTTYQGSHEVAEERLNVCRLLLELDPVHEADYRLEINELLRRQVISKRKREVEQSRIHIELPKLHVWANAQLQEPFTRYLTFLRTGLDVDTSPARAEALAQSQEQARELTTLRVPDDEVLLLFSRLVMELRNAYTSSSEFGLNRYLSTRIRHGTLETQLRRPVTAHHLITQRESENGPYQPNTHWADQLNLGAAERAALNEVFAEFSADYDKLIASIRTNWVQIRLRADQEGMFDFILNASDMAWLVTNVTTQTTFREFVDLVVEHLGERLTKNLDLIRHRLQEEAWPAARVLLSNLQKKIHALNQRYMFTELDSAIKIARTETASVFERVVAWFRPTQAVGSSPYFLEDVLSVAEALVRETAPDFQAPISVAFTNDNNQVVLAHGLTTLVDIFVNIFENVVRRSGLESPQARLELRNIPISTNQSIISVVTRNALGANINQQQLRLQLEQKRQELAEGKYSSSITKEGGSGFFKIHRSLRDFRTSDLMFGIEDDEFFVEVRLLIDWHRVAKSDAPRLEHESI